MAQGNNNFWKDPNAVLDYAVDWEDWLGTDEIASSTWIVPTGITKDSDTETTTKTIIWLSGGTVGTRYTLVNQIITIGDRTDERSICIDVRER